MSEFAEYRAGFITEEELSDFVANRPPREPMALSDIPETLLNTFARAGLITDLRDTPQPNEENES